MSKSKHKNWRLEDREYEDGPRRKEPRVDKRKQRRFEHGLRTRNIDELLSTEDDDNDNEVLDMFPEDNSSYY